MFSRSLAAGVIAAGLAFAVADDAEAKTRVHVGIGLPGFGYGYGYGYSAYYAPSYYGYGYGYPYRSYGYGYPYRSYGYASSYRSYGYGHYRRPYAAHGVSCGEAGRILRRNGWRNLRANDCGGSVYSFVGHRGGRPYLVRVSSRSGAIIGQRRY